VQGVGGSNPLVPTNLSLGTLLLGVYPKRKVQSITRVPTAMTTFFFGKKKNVRDSAQSLGPGLEDDAGAVHREKKQERSNAMKR
jgi:hypothetical protein